MLWTLWRYFSGAATGYSRPRKRWVPLYQLKASHSHGLEQSGIQNCNFPRWVLRVKPKRQFSAQKNLPLRQFCWKLQGLISSHFYQRLYLCERYLGRVSGFLSSWVLPLVNTFAKFEEIGPWFWQILGVPPLHIRFSHFPKKRWTLLAQTESLSYFRWINVGRQQSWWGGGQTAIITPKFPFQAILEKTASFWKNNRDLPLLFISSIVRLYVMLLKHPLHRDAN